MTDATSETKKRGANGMFGRAFLSVTTGATVALLIATVILVIVFGFGGPGKGLSEYEKQAIEVVSMQKAPCRAPYTRDDSD